MDLTRIRTLLQEIRDTDQLLSIDAIVDEIEAVLAEGELDD